MRKLKDLLTTHSMPIWVSIRNLYPAYSVIPPLLFFVGIVRGIIDSSRLKNCMWEEAPENCQVNSMESLVDIFCEDPMISQQARAAAIECAASDHSWLSSLSTMGLLSFTLASAIGLYLSIKQIRQCKVLSKSNGEGLDNHKTVLGEAKKLSSRHNLKERILKLPKKFYQNPSNAVFSDYYGNRITIPILRSDGYLCDFEYEEKLFETKQPRISPKTGKKLNNFLMIDRSLFLDILATLDSKNAPELDEPILISPPEGHLYLYESHLSSSIQQLIREMRHRLATVRWQDLVFKAVFPTLFILASMISALEIGGEKNE